MGIDPDKSIKLGFEWGGMTEEIREAMAAQLGAEGTRARTRTPSIDEYLEDKDVSKKDFASPSLRRMRSGPKKYSFWIDVKLARNQ